jgi:hypothetical protein
MRKSNGVHKNNTRHANRVNAAFTKWQQSPHIGLVRDVNEVFTKTTHKIDRGATLLRLGDAPAFTESIYTSSCYRHSRAFIAA